MSLKPKKKKQKSKLAVNEDIMSFGGMPIPMFTRDEIQKSRKRAEKSKKKRDKKKFIEQWSEKERINGKQDLAEKAALYRVKKYYVDDETTKNNQFFELQDIVTHVELNNRKREFRKDKQYKIVPVSNNIYAIYEETWFDTIVGKWV